METISKIKDIICLYELPLQDLLAKAQEVAEQNEINTVEFCSLISAKTGKCGENCRYCAQSSHYMTNIETHPLVSIEDVKTAALSSRHYGVKRFAIVTSGKTPCSEDFSEMLEMIGAINEIDGLTSCASLGILNEEEVILLKKAGLTRYHHNINTSESHYKNICTTHSFQDRLDTINLLKKYDIELCCGVILGMGETREQRAQMALELQQINPHSIPVNFLHPIKGTPMEDYREKIDAEEILRTLAVFRIVMPKTYIRYAGGRLERFPKDYQEMGIKAGVNAILIGNMLTTIGITPEEDINLVKKCSKEVEK